MGLTSFDSEHQRRFRELEYVKGRNARIQLLRTVDVSLILMFDEKLEGQEILPLLEHQQSSDDREPSDLKTAPSARWCSRYCLHLTAGTAVLVAAVLLWFLSCAAVITVLLLRQGVDDRISLNVHIIHTNVLQRLVEGQPVVLGVVGGSISNRNPPFWHTQVVEWLNMTYPVTQTRVKNNVSLSAHTLLSAAMGGTESDNSALCLDSLFEGLKPDLLLVEFGYNDAGMEHSNAVDTAEDLALHPAANYERIARRAISGWNAAVILVEIPSLNYNTRRPEPTEGSAGTAHLIPALRYGLPIVDLGLWWHNWPQPQKLQEDGYYGNDFIHILGKAGAILADLVAQELEYHLSFVTPPEPILESGPMTQSWRHLLGPPWHGTRVAPLSGKVLPFPAPLFASTVLDFACLLPRLHHDQNAALFGSQLVSASGWEWGAQTRDGGRTRSKPRPGFVTYNRTDPLIFELPASSHEALVFYRRSWEPCAMATVWTSTNRQLIESPPNALLLNGSWSQRNTQMTAATIAAPPDVTSTSSYFLFVQNTGTVTAQPHPNFRDAFFKVYGIGESREHSGTD